MTDLECPRCGGDLRDLACAGCGARYERVFGVPFIGDYEPEDALGLIEIAANVPFREALAFSPDAVEAVDALNSAYHAAPDKGAFKRANPKAEAPYFPFRYSQWLEAQNIIGPVELKGRKVLDIGAGAGFDSYRLAARGAEVTALEINPLLAEAGKKGFSSFRWIGGLSHALPFKSGSFDAVFFNAALHHMRDIPASISEALRVLRPGGQLVTTADSFRADHQTIDLEYQIFDKNPDVLLGVNEQIPPFGDFVKVLEQNRDIVDVELFTTHLYGQPDDTTLRQWDLDKDAEALRRRSGSLAMRIKLLKPCLTAEDFRPTERYLRRPTPRG